MTAGDADAEDLAQEAFVRAWRSIGTFRSDSTFRTWVFGIAINLVRHASRQAFAAAAPVLVADAGRNTITTRWNGRPSTTGSRLRWPCAR